LALKEQQDAEFMAFENQYEKLHNIFEKRWKAEFDQAAAEDKEEINNLKLRQDQELKLHQEALEKNPPIKFRESAEYLRLRKVQEYMSSQKRFEEAWRAKCDAEKCHEQNIARWNDAVTKKIANFQRHLQQTHDNQMTSFIKKLNAKMAER
jgi:hypothetical protein